MVGSVWTRFRIQYDILNVNPGQKGDRLMSQSPRFSREDWQAWRQAGWSAVRIARHIHLSVSRVNQLARHIGRTPQNDPLYYQKPFAYTPPDLATEVGAYALGILWGTASVLTPHELIIRHRDKDLMVYAQKLLQLPGIPTVITTTDGIQARYRIRRQWVAHQMIDWLQDLGWTPRQAAVRPYPRGDLCHRAFIRAWTELHAAADRPRLGRQRREYPRLRIYGNQALLESINTCIDRESELGLRTLQKTSNTSTKALYYTGNSAHALLQWLYANATVYHFPARDRLISVLFAPTKTEPD